MTEPPVDAVPARDAVILDVPETSREAHARLLGKPPGPAITVGGVELVVGLPEWASSSGLLIGEADDTGGAVRLTRRRGLAVADGGRYHPAAVHGLTLGVVGPESRECEQDRASDGESDVVGLDHLVLLSPNADRTIATMCGRLGFDLRLDRVQDWGVHQLFLRRAALLVEVVIQDGDPYGDDALWGTAWRTADIDATHARLTAEGVTVSEVRTGRKPGTRVATVKDPALGIPTIVIEQR
ncbi:glyoxalase [Tsukamurella sp. 8F]|uniref:VOC family protein n=1 Tax=unclassified Tsukamurella TaxID=2633480 RepID=UPI0023B9E1C7|nr:MULTISPECIES: VOC family protein [unclassified Tsukamurella]MDF0528557.1 glyoxalase [Tsukamurella sp. 8J]MDF0585519.1 glyoxalase [Tsukamurella sp. 8F]